MIEEPLISIITPAYNASKFIAETIESVRNQTYKNWEMLIVDDCSTDDTAIIIKKYQQLDSRIIYYKLEKNSGVAGIPRNFGIEKAIGNFIAFIDADDIWLPDKLEKQLTFLQNSNADLVYTNLIYFYPNGKEYKIKTRQVTSLFSILMSNPISTSSVLVKNSMFIIFDPNLKVGEDQFLWITLFKNNISIQHLDEYLLKYRYNSNSLLHKSAINSLFDGYRVILKLGKTYDNNPITIVFYIILQTIIRTSNVLIGILKRQIIQKYIISKH